MELISDDLSSSVLNLISTPVAIMARYGLTTSVGVTADDPANNRNVGVEYSVLVSIYGKSCLMGRVSVGTVGPGEHYFVSVDEVLMAQGWVDEATFCVVHRVPTNYFSETGLENELSVLEHNKYSMYRTVVQYGLENGGAGSVIYETPPNLNSLGKRSSFLTFSNKACLRPSLSNHLIFLNYSVNPKHSKSAHVFAKFFDSDGSVIANYEFDVPPMDFFCVSLDWLMGKTDSTFLSFTAASADASLLPLSIIVDKAMGGVSVEHSHPPQEYLLADWQPIALIRRKAIDYWSKG